MGLYGERRRRQLLARAVQHYRLSAGCLLLPVPLVTLVVSAVLVLLAGRRLCWNSGGFTGEAGSMAAAVLITTLWVDGLFLLSALLQPGLSGLIE